MFLAIFAFAIQVRKVSSCLEEVPRPEGRWQPRSSFSNGAPTHRASEVPWEAPQKVRRAGLAGQRQLGWPVPGHAAEAQ